MNCLTKDEISYNGGLIMVRTVKHTNGVDYFNFYVAYATHSSLGSTKTSIRAAKSHITRCRRRLLLPLKG